MTSTERLSAAWSRARECLRRKFPDLTDDDLELIEGREENLFETIAHKTGHTRQAVIDLCGAIGLFRAS